MKSEHRLLAVVLAASTGCSAAADPAMTPVPANATTAADTVAPLGTEAADLLQRVRALNTPSSTNRITVYYAEGYEDKALRLRSLVEEGMNFYADSLAVQAPLHLAVLTKEQWERVITWQPYGFPGVAGSPPVAFLPATDDGVAANDALSIRAAVSPASVRIIEASGHSYEEGSRRYVDLVGLHELGHTYSSAYGIRSSHKRLGELLASYFAYAFLRQHQPKKAQLWDGILQSYLDAVRPQYTSLDDFERLYFGVGPQNYVWYQAKFQEMARRAYDARGLGFLREVRAAFPRTETVPVSMDTALERLERIQPGFRAWAEELGSTTPHPGGSR